MADDSTPIGSHQDTGDDAQRARGDGDDGHIADGGAEHPEEVLSHVMREEAVNAETKSAVDQQVQHLNHFCSYQSFLIFLYLSYFLFFVSQSFFTLPLHQVPGSTASDTTGVVGR
jgi:hypothetical protein